MRSHAILDCESRVRKALKIERLVKKVHDFKFGKMLEVGCGSGQISAYFSDLGYGEAGTHAVDVVDERQRTHGYQFDLVADTSLPFPDATFDFVISNHVVEHVGEECAQVHHLKEIFRCLSAGNVLYFAVPNRWRIVEPHYKLPFLSWLPEGLASQYIRILGLGSHYDCRPLSRSQVIALLEEAGFEYEDLTLDAIPLIGELEGGFVTRLITKLPKFIWKLGLPVVPTLIFVCRRPG